MELFGTKIGRKKPDEKNAIDRVHTEALGLTSIDLKSPECFPKPDGVINAEMASRIYMYSPYVNAAVRIVAGSLSSVPLNVYMKERGGKYSSEKLTGQPYSMLEFVNTFMTQSQLIDNTASWLMLTGNAYWAIEPTPSPYDAYSKISIYPLNPQFVTIRPDPDTHANLYFYEVDSELILIPAERIVHFKGFHPNDYWYGYSVLNALQTDLQIERLAKKQASNFYAQAAVISGTLEVPQDLDEDEIRKMKREFFTQYSGSRNSYRIMVLTNGMKYEPIKSVLGDSQTVQVLEQSLDIHSVVMGVPAPIMLGKSANKELIDAEALLWKKTIIPLGTLIDQTVSKHLALPLSDRLSVRFDYSNVEALRLQDLDRTKVEVAQVMAGLRTPNEVRVERKWGPYTEYSEFGDMPAPVYQAKMEASLSLSLPGSQGGRDQSSTGETQHIDTTGRRGFKASPYKQEFIKYFLSEE